MRRQRPGADVEAPSGRVSVAVLTRGDVVATPWPPASIERLVADGAAAGVT